MNLHRHLEEWHAPYLVAEVMKSVNSNQVSVPQAGTFAAMEGTAQWMKSQTVAGLAYHWVSEEHKVMITSQCEHNDQHRKAEHIIYRPRLCRTTTIMV